ncbi:MAG: hypothetical protein ABIT71_06680 [Vicinamibacteraceae bacterium]
MAEIRLPIVVNDSGDVSAFASIEEAERFLEPEDIGQGEVFDADGRVLISSVTRHLLAKRVRLTPSEEVVPDRLRRALVSYLEALGGRPSRPFGEWALDALVDEIADLQRIGPK